jgi:hypothetical protein
MSDLILYTSDDDKTRARLRVQIVQQSVGQLPETLALLPFRTDAAFQKR